MRKNAEKGRKEVEKMKNDKYLESLYWEKEMYQLILNNSFRMNQEMVKKAEELMPEIDGRIKEYKEFLKRKERG